MSKSPWSKPKADFYQEHRVPDAECPHCHKALSGALAFNHLDKPTVGALTCCWYCANLSEFGEDMQLRKLSEVDLAVAMSHKEVQQAIATVKAILLEKAAKRLAEKQRDS